MRTEVAVCYRVFNTVQRGGGERITGNLGIWCPATGMDKIEMEEFAAYLKVLAGDDGPHWREHLFRIQDRINGSKGVLVMLLIIN